MKSSVLLLAAFLLKVLVSSPGGQAQTTGCPDGYVYHQPSRLCYKAFNDRTTYIGAVARCSLDGGTLAMPRDTATNEFLIDLQNAVDVNGWFRFGLTYRRQDGVWVWDDNVPLGDFTAWGPGEPNNDGGDREDCAEYFPEFWFKKNTWNDGSCTEAGKFICQVSPPGRSPEGSSQPPTQPATQPTTTQGYTTEENLSSHHPVEVGSRPSRQVPADEKVGPGVLAGVAIATAVAGFILGVGVSQLVQWCRSKPKGGSARQADLEGKKWTIFLLPLLLQTNKEKTPTRGVWYLSRSLAQTRRGPSGSIMMTSPQKARRIFFARQAVSTRNSGRQNENGEEEGFVEPIARDDSTPYEPVDDSYLELVP
ncbi:uncharacterized protein LOC144914303 [Branchiostoma floridae x Branchiostoma belcheri]